MDSNKDNQANDSEDCSQVKCPMQSRLQCQWYGKLDNLQDHCIEIHSKDTKRLNLKAFVILNFIKNALERTEPTHSNNLNRYYFPFLLKAGSELFHLESDNIAQTNITRWFITHLGPKHETDQLTYTIAFQNKEKILKFRGECQPYVQTTFADIKFSHLLKAHMKSMCDDRRGNVFVDLKIYKNGTLLNSST